MTKRILLIDDEKDVVQIMSKRIRNAGYEVDLAYNGKEGLEAARQQHPHLILTDVVMPVMDGFTFYNELKKSHETCHIPVIIASAYWMTEDAFRGLGAKDFLLKPFDSQSLVDKVESYFEDHRACKVLIATKMIYLMRNIVSESQDFIRNLDIKFVNDPQTLVDEANDFQPDMMMVDIDMFLQPSAAEVIANLRRQENLRETVILLNRSMLGDLAAQLGSQYSKQIIEECLASGGSHYLGSLNRSTFLSVVHEYCR